MTCSICGGRVEWQGPLSNLTHTRCATCGAINCQEVDPLNEDGADTLEVCGHCGPEDVDHD